MGEGAHIYALVVASKPNPPPRHVRRYRLLQQRHPRVRVHVHHHNPPITLPKRPQHPPQPRALLCRRAPRRHATVEAKDADFDGGGGLSDFKLVEAISAVRVRRRHDSDACAVRSGG
jgi:hypothetical protein